MIENPRKRWHFYLTTDSKLEGSSSLSRTWEGETFGEWVCLQGRELGHGPVEVLELSNGTSGLREWSGAKSSPGWSSKPLPSEKGLTCQIPEDP